MGGQQRIAAVAASLGADPTAVNDCYTEYTVAAQIQSCVSGQLNALAYQTNFSAPTEGQFFGGLLGAATPARFASYLAPLLTVWQLFVAHGHQEYEYLPTTLSLADRRDPSSAAVQVVAGEKVPTLRPPAAQSSVVFFSIGEQNGSQPPRVVNDASAPAICAREPRLELPLHLNQTSRYLNRTALIVTATGGATRRIPVDPSDVDAPILDRSAIDDGHDVGYRVSLSGQYGFDALAQPVQPSLYVAVPRAAPWQIAAAPHRVVAAGGTLDLVAAGAAAPCVSNAELQVGGTRLLPVQTTLVDPTHVALHASLAGVPPGDAVLRLYQSDPGSGRPVESDEAVAIAPPPAHIADEAPLVHVGDTAIALSGSGFDRIRALRVGDDTWRKVASASTAAEACFSGSPVALHAEPGAELTATLVRNDGSTGQAFAIAVGPPRPDIASVTASSDSATHLSTDILRVVLKSANPLPANPVVLVRRAPAHPQPCSSATGSATVAADRVHVLDATSLEAYVQADALLHDEAFGALQIALSNPPAQAASDWMAVPGSFVRAPLISDIDCSAAATATCRLVGSDLLTIAGVVMPNGSLQPPDLRCTPTAEEPSSSPSHGSLTTTSFLPTARLRTTCPTPSYGIWRIAVAAGTTQSEAALWRDSRGHRLERLGCHRYQLDRLGMVQPAGRRSVPEGALRWLRRRQRPGRLPRLVVRRGDDDCFRGNVIIALVTGRCNSDVAAGGCDRAGWGARVRGRAAGAAGGRPRCSGLCGGAGHRQDDGVAGGGRAGAGLAGRGAGRAPGGGGGRARVRRPGRSSRSGSTRAAASPAGAAAPCSCGRVAVGGTGPPSS